MADDDQGGVPPAPHPGTTEEWRAYLTEYSDWYLRSLDEEDLARMPEEQLQSRFLGYPPADEKLIAATEERLGVALPPSLKSFLLTSNGWGRVAGWIDELYSCEDIEWFADRHSEWLDKDSDGSDDVFRYGLSVAEGEDIFLLDTSDVLENGEYRSYFLAVKYGELSGPCGSFSELLTRGRSELKYVLD